MSPRKLIPCSIFTPILPESFSAPLNRQYMAAAIFFANIFHEVLQIQPLQF